MYLLDVRNEEVQRLDGVPEDPAPATLDNAAPRPLACPTCGFHPLSGLDQDDGGVFVTCLGCGNRVDMERVERLPDGPSLWRVK